MTRATRKAARRDVSPPSYGQDPGWIVSALAAAGDVAYAWDLASGRLSWSANPVLALRLEDGPVPADRASLIGRVHPDDVTAIEERLSRHLQSAAPFEVEYRLRGRGPEPCWIQERGAADIGPDGVARRVVGVLRQVTERKRRESSLERRANYDELTGHYNVGRLREALDHALAYARRYDSSGAYVVVAIDDLALLGDVYGHEVADAALVAVGQQLDRCIRDSDTVGRAGHDRFGVVLDSCPHARMETVVAKIAAAVDGAPVPCDVGPLQVSASICAVAFPGKEASGHEVMVRADQALRHGGKEARVALATPDRPARGSGEVRRDLAIAERLRWCLQNDAIGLAFQPVVRACSGDVAYYECLLRLLGDGAMPHGAGQIVKAAERTGLIRQVDRRALELAVQELTAHPGLRLAINVSGLTTSDRQWLRRLAALVQGRGDVAARLMVEITETAAMIDLDESVRFVATLHDLGCQAALDDFGAGHTSFRNLKSLAVDIVKIDGSFTASLKANPGDIAFVAALQNLANACGLLTVAEWVEDGATGRLLADHGVDYLQGYHFGRPAVIRPWARTIASMPAP